MLEKTEQKNKAQMSDDQWDTVSADADETCKLAPKDEADGLALRYRVQGVFLGTKVVDGLYGESELYLVRMQENGSDYVLGIWGFRSMSRTMAEIEIGTPIRITYKGEKDTGKASPMKLAEVQIPKGYRRKESQKESF